MMLKAFLLFGILVFNVTASIAQTDNNIYFLKDKIKFLEDNTMFIKNRGFNQFGTVINEETRRYGSYEVNWSFSNVSKENQTWYVVKIIGDQTEDLRLKLISFSEVEVKAATWGPFFVHYPDIEKALGELPTDTLSFPNENELILKKPKAGALYIIGFKNTSNVKSGINIQVENGEADLYRFDPRPVHCELPTAEFISEDILIRPDENVIFIPTIRFTGDGPWSFSIVDGTQLYSSDQSIYNWNTYSWDQRPYLWELSSVMNECGTGSIIKNPINYLVYKTETELVSCIPFNNSFEDKTNGLKFSRTGGTFVSNQNNEPAAAIKLNGINESLELPARDQLGENYVIGLWIKPEYSNSPSQAILRLGSDESSSQKLDLKKDGSGYWYYNFEVNLRSGSRYSITLPATENWTYLTLKKDSTKISIQNQYGNSSETYLNSFDVPSYKTNSKLLFGINHSGNEFFHGSYSQFKYFSGQLPDSILNNLKESGSCEFKLCEGYPIVNLPGHIRLNPGYLSKQVTVGIESKAPDRFSFQTNDDGYQKYIPGHALAFKTHSDFNNVIFQLKRNNNNSYQSISYLNGLCGTADYRGTLEIFNAPLIKYCFPFNNTYNEYLGKGNLNSNLNFGFDRQNLFGKAAHFYSENHHVRFFEPEIEKNNYSVIGWIQASSDIQTNREYDIFSIEKNNREERFFLRKNSNNNFSFVFQDLAVTNVENTFELPNITDEWHHIAITFLKPQPSGLKTISLFLDGKEIETQLVKTFNIYDTYRYFTIGNSAPTVIRKSFLGHMDDLKIYDGALSAKDVLNLYYDTKECLSPLCENLPTLSEIAPDLKELNYGIDELNIDLKLTNLPLQFKIGYNGDKGLTYFSQIDSVNYNTVTPNYNMNMGRNTYSVATLINHCGIVNPESENVFYLKPAQNYCINFNNIIENGSNLGTGTLESNNVNFAEDRNGNPSYSASFDSNSNLAIYNSSLRAKDLTYSFWLKPESNTDSTILLFHGNSTNYNLALLVKNSSNDYSVLLKRDGVYLSEYAIKLLNSSSILNTNDWTHVTFVFNNMFLKIYFDGILVNETLENGHFSAPNIDFNSRIQIAGSALNYSGFKGKIDGLNIFNGTLNDFEIKSLVKLNECNFNYCPDKFDLSDSISMRKYQATNSIKSSSKVSSDVGFSAIQSINLNPGFETQKGAIFKASIEGCTY